MSSLGESIQKFRESLASLGKRGGGSSEPSSGGGGKFDAKAALSWVKSHPVIVASVAAMALAPAAAWWFSAEMHAARDEAASKRSQEMAALEKLEKTPIEITLPGQAPEQKVGVVNQKTVDAYKRLADRLRGDAFEVQKAALARNQAGRDRLLVPVTVDANNTNLIAETVFEAVRKRAAEGLKAARAGMPPSDQSLVDQLQRRQDQFVAAERKADRKSLSAEQLARLQDSLLDKRLQLYADAASNVSFYADIADLGLPVDPLEAGTPPSEVRMFLWQWRLWIIEDILGAVAAANKPYRSVSDSPVKRILSISVAEDALPKAPAADAGSAQPEGEPSAEGGGEAPAAAFAPIDPKAPVAYDFRKTMTGRVSNALYDVRYASVQLVVATTAIPEVVNAFAKQNLMTVVKLRVRPADAFEAAEDGYVYGSEPVSQVDIDLESVWLRPWLARLMPRELQKLKGTDGRTVDDPAPAPTAEPAS